MIWQVNRRTRLKALFDGKCAEPLRKPIEFSMFFQHGCPRGGFWARAPSLAARLPPRGPRRGSPQCAPPPPSGVARAPSLVTGVWPAAPDRATHEECGLSKRAKLHFHFYFPFYFRFHFCFHSLALLRSRLLLLPLLLPPVPLRPFAIALLLSLLLSAMLAL